MKLTYTTKQRRQLVEIDASCVTNLIRTTSSSSFTQPSTFGKGHHSLPYSILSNFLHGLHPNGTSFRDSQLGVPKLEFLLSQNFLCLYLLQIKHVWNMQGQYLIGFNKAFSTTYGQPQLELI
jgi:hypothetical protein